jgi:small-conductance mechanosensitive channel
MHHSTTSWPEQGVDPTLVNFTASLVYYAGLAVVIIAALNRLGVQTASLIAVLGAAGLAVGLALTGIALKLRGWGADADLSPL